MKNWIYVSATICLNVFNGFSQTYNFPDESEEHEGTWLQWPHHYEYGLSYRNENDATWVAMTDALQENEKVFIIAYNTNEINRISDLLINSGVPLTNVVFVERPTNDVWIRDNGPIFVWNQNNELVIQDWGFNGWGEDYNYNLCDPIPTSLSGSLGLDLIDLNSVMTVEGGSWELDGNGTFLATRSSILCQSNPVFPVGIFAERNVGMTESEADTIFANYLGAEKFIWLEGFYSLDDITDAHIDGFAKFAPGNKLFTMSQSDLLYWGLIQSDIDILYSASNSNNVEYSKVILPLTVNDVHKTNGTNLGYKGSYLNFYVANNRVLVPNYSDPNDAVANAIIANNYPGRTVVGIDVRNLYSNGGMVHCVTQQQPAISSNSIKKNEDDRIEIYPNPSKDYFTIELNSDESVNATLVNNLGEVVLDLESCTSKTIIDISHLPKGTYFLKINSLNKKIVKL